ncbi:hypothetical protein G7Z17_g2910 [Cylindrodendrum hubeiense]|uniref:Uncharacterized protein n=1 Tax=Cylindrodendrum hubeiense TaxID=595255 RepID=A0A9P5HGT0_9HYPO|nr:hypothetical protein G7Z17_g2910 [Cylindrodendrum hubeiense]
MASICNYSHPELQITDGLIRQQSGSLFPYNPEFYERATGLYGPGSIYCWYFMLASTILNWACTPKDEDGYRRPGLSNDLLAVVAYPMFAATDALVQAMKALGTDQRALALFCLRFPETDLTGFAKFNNTQLNLHDIPPDVLDLGQRVIDITGPLTVCYTFTAVCIALIIWFADIFSKTLLRPTPWTKRAIYIAYGYVVLTLTIFHLSLGNLGISLILSVYEAMVPVEFVFVFGSLAVTALSFLGSVGMMIESCMKRNMADFVEALKTLGAVIIIAAITGVMVFVFFSDKLRLVPDLAVTVGERDQLATLIVGVVTLTFTLLDVIRDWQPDTEIDNEEMQTLNTDVENGDSS